MQTSFPFVHDIQMPRCCIDKFINRNNTPLVTLISTNTAKNQKYESAGQTSFANTRTWLPWLGNRGTTAHQACVMRDNSLSWREPNLKPGSHMLEISVEACEDDQNLWMSDHRFLCFLKAETSVFTKDWCLWTSLATAGASLKPTRPPKLISRTGFWGFC